jgi:hypothetical protein
LLSTASLLHYFESPSRLPGASRQGGNGVCKQDRADFLAAVQTRAIEYVEENGTPKDAAGREGLMIRIARNYLCDRCDKRKTAKKWNTGLPDRMLAAHPESTSATPMRCPCRPTLDGPRDRVAPSGVGWYHQQQRS